MSKRRRILVPVARTTALEEECKIRSEADQAIWASVRRLELEVGHMQELNIVQANAVLMLSARVAEVISLVDAVERVHDILAMEQAQIWEGIRMMEHSTEMGERIELQMVRHSDRYLEIVKSFRIMKEYILHELPPSHGCKDLPDISKL